MRKRFQLKKPGLKRTRNTGGSKRITRFRVGVAALAVVGIGLYGLGTVAWYNKSFTDQETVFYDMLDKSLSTDSVLRNVTQTEGTRDISQSYYTTFSPKLVVQSLTALEQIDSAREKSKVTTETIGGQDTDYVRYKSIELPASQAGQQNFNEVIGQWATRSSEQSPAELLNESIFTFFPMGNFSDENREFLIEKIKADKVYDVTNARVVYEGARPTMVMDVTIEPAALVGMLREYAQISGVGNLEALDPAQYERSSSIGVVITVDLLSRHLTLMEFPGQSRSETFHSYGLNRTIEEPTKTITIDELQSRIAQ